MTGSERVDQTALERALRAEVDGEVRFDAGSRGAYATDGSNYRQVPLGVVVPRTVEAGAAAESVSPPGNGRHDSAPRTVGYVFGGFIPSGGGRRWANAASMLCRPRTGGST